MFNIAIWEYEFLSPYWLVLLFLVPFVVWKFWSIEKKKKGSFQFSNLERLQLSLEEIRTKRLRNYIYISYGLASVLFVIALAKPYHWESEEVFDHKFKFGIDIILAMDVSASMLAKDFEPSRLEVSKEMAKEFIDSRLGDRIGLVVYEGEAYTACPATLDYSILKAQIDILEPGNIEGGTAIGTGLGTAVTRLRNDSIKSKVIILLTDGTNNSGSISPETAAQLAKEKKVKVYTIGVGSIGMAPTPVRTPFGIQYENMPVTIDESTLQNIATITGGKYYRAKDAKGLRSIYREIDRLEKHKIEDVSYNTEPPTNPTPFILFGILFLMSGWILQRFILKTDE